MGYSEQFSFQNALVLVYDSLMRINELERLWEICIVYILKQLCLYCEDLKTNLRFLT